MSTSPLLPLFPIKDPVITQWQTRWKAILDAIIKKSDISTATTTNISQLNIQQSASSGSSASILGGSSAFLTNLTVTIKTTGKPVMVQLQAAPQPGTNTRFGFGQTGPATASARLSFVNNSNTITTMRLEYNSTTLGYTYPATVSYVDTPAAGSQTYQVFVQNDASLNFFYVSMVLIAYELGT